MSDRILSDPGERAALNDEVLWGLGAEACVGFMYWKKMVQVVLEKYLIFAMNVL